MDNNLIELEYDTYGEDEKEEGLKMLEALLTIRVEGNVIYITHPRHLFDTLGEDNETKEIKYVDFGSLNVLKMRRINDFGWYSIVEQICNKMNNQFTYMIKKARHMMMKYQSDGATHLAYPLVVLEEINVNPENPQYLVRGFVSFKQDKIAIAFNPSIVRVLPQESVWQRSLRFSGHFNE